MKTQAGIWIDTQEAMIVFITGKETNTRTIHSKIENRIYHENEGDKGTFTGNRHGNQEKKFEERKHHQVKEYLDQVIREVEHVEEILIFGPAQMKMHLKTALESDKPLADRSIVVEAAESMSANQLIAKVKEHFTGHGG